MGRNQTAKDWTVKWSWLQELSMAAPEAAIQLAAIPSRRKSGWRVRAPPWREIGIYSPVF